MAQFTNQARLSYNDTVINSNIAVGEILEVLSGSKTALSDNYAIGDDITYVISIVNSGATAVSGITVTDDLGAYEFGTLPPTATLYPLTYVDGSVRLFIGGVLQPAPTVLSTTPLSFGGITLPANSNLILVYEASVNEFAPLGTDGTIVNTATVTGTGITTPVEISETVSAATEPNLTIIKSIEPIPIAENGRVTYTFVIQNYGNTAADATANAIVEDTFDPLLSDLVVSFNGTAWTEPANYTYNNVTGEFATVAGQITVPAAVYTQDPDTGVQIVTPGVSTLTVTGTI